LRPRLKTGKNSPKSNRNLTGVVADCPQHQGGGRGKSNDQSNRAAHNQQLPNLPHLRPGRARQHQRNVLHQRRHTNARGLPKLHRTHHQSLRTALRQMRHGIQNSREFRNEGIGTARLNGSRKTLHGTRRFQFKTAQFKTTQDFQGGRMKHFKSLTAILVMLTLVLASCGTQTPINDASSSTDQSTDGSGENLGAEGIIVVPTRTAPTVTITSTSYQDIDLRVETDLAKLFKVTHPTRTSLALTVTSDKDGVLFDGTWNIDPTLFVPSALKRTFATPGTRAITVTARVGLLKRTGTFYLNVINTAPVIKLHYDGNPYAGDRFYVMAQIFDKNEPDGTKMCANTTWTLDAPNVLNTNSGCNVRLDFTNVFTYQLRVSTHDSEGAVAVQAINLSVLPAFTDERLKYKRGYFADFNFVPTGKDTRCSNTPVGSNAYFNLPCNYYSSIWMRRSENQLETGYKNMFSIFVTDSQGKEVLLSSISGQGGTSYGPTPLDENGNSSENLYSYIAYTYLFVNIGNYAPVTRDCRIAVTIDDLALNLSRTTTVWVGKCTYNTQTLN
jgi:hypothetical protein